MAAVLRWWALFCIFIASAMVIGASGLFNVLWVDDLSKLSFVALSVFSILTVFIGWLTYKIHIDKVHNFGGRGDGGRGVYHLRFLRLAWFSAEALMGIGMMGTLLGFIMMFQSNISHIDFSNIDTAKSILAQLTKGTTTAVVTTFVGLTTSLLTKLQLVSLELDLSE